MQTPRELINKPLVSYWVIISSKNIHAFNAVIGDIKKNKLEVWLTVQTLIKYIKIVNDPNDNAIIYQLIGKIKSELKIM